MPRLSLAHLAVCYAGQLHTAHALMNQLDLTAVCDALGISRPTPPVDRQWWSELVSSIRDAVCHTDAFLQSKDERLYTEVLEPIMMPLDIATTIAVLPLVVHIKDRQGNILHSAVTGFQIPDSWTQQALMGGYHHDEKPTA
jgi:hypothetical protein